MSTVNSITITDTSNISVVTAGTQGVAGPNTILGRSVVTSTAGTSGSLLVYDHAIRNGKIVNQQDHNP